MRLARVSAEPLDPESHVKAPALLGFACLAWLSACTRPAVLLNAPPELDGAEVFVNEHKVGELKTSVYYRWTGLRGARAETSAPPRHEANLAIPELREGSHNLRIAKRGYREFRGTFVYRGGHLELFIPDKAARKWPVSNSALHPTPTAASFLPELYFSACGWRG